MVYQEIISKSAVEKEANPEIPNEKLLKALKSKVLVIENGNVIGVFDSVKAIIEHNKEQMAHGK